MQYSHRPEEGLRSPGTEVTGASEPSWGFQRLSSGPLQEQQSAINSEPSSLHSSPPPAAPSPLRSSSGIASAINPEPSLQAPLQLFLLLIFYLEFNKV